MYEFGIKMKSGESEIIFGYNFADALFRWGYLQDEIDYIQYQEYVD